MPLKIISYFIVLLVGITPIHAAPPRLFHFPLDSASTQRDQTENVERFKLLDPVLRNTRNTTSVVVALAPETTEATERHNRVAARKKQTHIICHRGASEFAHENTLEAYRATFELGADGNEIDIRMTRDGMLVCFHDDMLDQLLEAYGDVSDVTWAELQQFRFRAPGRFGEQCRIPTLAEVFELHRQYAGLMHLDIKRPNLDLAIAKLLDQMDLWEHVISCSAELGAAIVKNPRVSLCRYKGGLYLDHGEVFPESIAKVLQQPGEGVIVDDPRGAILALGRKLGRVSTQPVAPRTLRVNDQPSAVPKEADLLAVLRDNSDWDQVGQTDAERLSSGQRILARARACDQLLSIKATSPEVFAALESRVRQRSLHKDWQFHGLDGALALRTLILLHAPQAAEVARFALWRDDRALEPVVNPLYKNPRAWTDFRVKMVIFPALARNPGLEAEQVCRDYLALTDDVAKQLGPSQFKPAGRALLAISPKTETALELLRHRLQAVRGRAILDCLAHASEAWAQKALQQGATHALAYVVPGF
ncbi:MAG: glpQ1 [Planctomycetaceae bacterium]|nr:glpQ1 [Planctomycetaceae bacterium]